MDACPSCGGTRFRLEPLMEAGGRVPERVVWRCISCRTGTVEADALKTDKGTRDSGPM